jgi:ubiquinone/menaquinone biosynthesis C-methylase UbiE
MTLASANARLSLGAKRVWPGEQYDVPARYRLLVAETINDAPGQIVVDVGGGRSLEYRLEVPREQARIIAVDVSAEELDQNEDVDERRVGDVSTRLPFDDAEVDLITSSSVLEHLRDVGGFLDEAARVLKDDGVMIHLFPSRYASFALVNRALPERVKRQLLFRVYPETEGRCGFEAHYDHCYFSAFVRECRKRGFEIDRVEPAYYGASDYYRVFFPLYLVSWLWELLASRMRARNLAAAMLVKARRPPRDTTSLRRP